MSSFTKMAAFPVGYFRATSQWLLRERRDVVSRVGVISAEMTRIGFVKMYYRVIDDGDNVITTEQRLGFSVTKNSNLSRLMQAYIATGGNPFNVSGFLHPDETTWEEGADLEGVRKQRYPHGGVVAPKSVDYNNPLPETGTDVDGESIVEKSGYEGYEGGYIESAGYMPGRMGGRIDRGAWDSNTIVRLMHDTRRWNNQAIKRRLHDMEARIIKQSDCWEQLRKERDEVLIEAFGGTLLGFPTLDEAMHDPKRLCQALIADMYSLLFKTDESGVPESFAPNDQIGYLFFAVKDAPEDEAGPM